MAQSWSLYLIYRYLNILTSKTDKLVANTVNEKYIMRDGYGKNLV